MAYFGYIEVKVRLLRQGHGHDSSGEPGSGFAVHATRTLRIEERDARFIGRSCDMKDVDAAEKADQELERVAEAIREVLDEDEMGDMRQRFDEATARLTPEKMRAVLEVLES